MPIPESKFDDWHGTGADKGSAQARRIIDRVMNIGRSPIDDDCRFKIILQGSYRNETHTYASSDVDVLVKIKSAWKKDLSELSSEEKQRYRDNTSSTDYGYHSFRNDVWSWAQSQFSGVSQGDKAIKINSDRSGRLPVDVDIVACGEYRVYHSYPEHGDPEFTTGMHFKPWTGTQQIVNFPTEHYQNGTEMHDNYKETVRIFKNSRDYYNKHWRSWHSIGAPSYFVECLIYNVPESILKRSNRSDRFEETLEYLQADDTDFSEFQQVSEMEPLFGQRSTQWDTDSADHMVSRLQEMWEDWYEQHNASLFN